MTVKEAMLKVSDYEFKMWYAYNKLSPIGLERFDLLFAMVCTTIAQVNAGKGKRYTVEDFMPKWNGESKKMTGKQMEDMLMAYTKVRNSSFKKA
jgi:hypothetical protein